MNYSTRIIWAIYLVIFISISANAETIEGNGSTITVTQKNITLVGDFKGVNVLADSVHLNMERAIIDCQNETQGIGVNLNDYSRVHVNGGTIRNCTIGVLMGEPVGDWPSAAGGSNNHVNNVTITDSNLGSGTWFRADGIALNQATNARIGNNTLNNIGGGLLSVAIRVFGGSDNDITNNNIGAMKPGTLPPIGIDIGGAGGSFDTTVHGNTISTVVGQAIRNAGAPGELSNYGKISGNNVIGNIAPALEDFHSDCGDNKWHGNTFDTATPSCIQ